MAYTLSQALKKQRNGRKMNASITYTKNEPYALCYYLSCIFEDKSNHEIYEDYEEAIKLFIENTKLLGKENRLEAVLNKEIHNLEINKQLKKISNPITENMEFDYFDIPYTYEQDKKVERAMRHFDNADNNLINIHRIMYVSEKPIFASIINATIFRDNEDYSLSSKINLTSKLKNSVFDISKTKFLMDNVNLNEEEARYLLLKCRFDTNENLRSIGRNCENEIRSCMPDLVGTTKKNLSYILRSDQKLKTFGFLDSDGDYDSSLNECIEAQSIEPYFSDLLKIQDCSNAYELNTFSIKEDSLEICKDLLNGHNPVSILFYGKPGSGKTELAKSLCKQTEKKIYIFKNESESDKKNNVLGRLVCLLAMERNDSILIVDEADSLIKTLNFSLFGPEPTETKGTINKMLENNKNKVIYIINHHFQIDESTRRRFTFSIKFEAMSSVQLHAIARTKIEPLELSDDIKNQILDMFDKYRLTGQSVDNIVKTIEGMECKDDEVLLRKANIVMKENALLLNGKAKMRDTVKAEYDPSVLNASMNPLQIIEMVENAAKFAEKNKGTESGIRMLFYGLSGTGKTELARYIAEKLGKQILLKRASDIFGKYVGENEQNIRDAFAEAEASDSILLFDEADSFFYDRNQAERSWERSTVNEFLTQMEEFSGILICTTNLKNIMDPAMQRRFHMLVEFKPMKFDGIKKMMERYFPAYHLSNKEIEELEDSESITPGDFGVLASRIRFMNQDNVNSEYILDELKKLQKEKKEQWHEEGNSSKGKIGFAV